MEVPKVDGVSFPNLDPVLYMEVHPQRRGSTQQSIVSQPFSRAMSQTWRPLTCLQKQDVVGSGDVGDLVLESLDMLVCSTATTSRENTHPVANLRNTFE